MVRANKIAMQVLYKKMSRGGGREEEAHRKIELGLIQLLTGTDTTYSSPGVPTVSVGTPGMEGPDVPIVRVGNV